MTYPNINALWCDTLIETLIQNGISRVVISPGSRSTPLALSAHKHLDAVIHTDERSAAFFALGQARFTRTPVALICTSGTAAANYAPAVIEASLARVPLLVITADRPPMVRGLGAAQTIDQVHLFGHAVRRFVDLPLPAMSTASLGALQAQVGIAVAAAANGPVHLNAPFEEPLAPISHNEEAVARLAETLRQPPRFYPANATADPAALAAAATMLKKAERPVIVAGSGGREACGGEDCLSFARALGAPLVADVASDLRGVGTVKHADAFLRGPDAPQPDLVVRVGGAPTGQGVIAYLNGLHVPVIALHTDMLGHESDLTATLAIAGDVSDALRRLQALLPEDATRLAAATGPRGTGSLCAMSLRPEQDAWLSLWERLDQRIARMISNAPTEARALLEAARTKPRLCLSNSLPVRHADTYWGGGHPVHTFRGANGIDGVTSQALGIAYASGEPTLLVTGDLAFMHDLGGLQVAHDLTSPLVVLVLNNDGGGIFSYLPIAKTTPDFETVFGTPHGLTFKAAGELFGLPYSRCATPEEVGAAVAQGLGRPGVSIVEFVTTRDQTASEHKAFIAWAKQQAVAP